MSLFFLCLMSFQVPPSKITNDDTLFACKIFLRKISKVTFETLLEMCLLFCKM